MLSEVLTLYRRHTKECPHADKGRRWTKCNCPVWVQGALGDEPVRASMQTRSWATAQARMAAMERGGQVGSASLKLFTEACEEFAESHEAGESTKFKYGQRLRRLREYAVANKLLHVAQWDLAVLDGYKRWRREKVGLLAWSKELQFLRQLWRWFVARKYTTENPAVAMKMPKSIPMRERVPYTEAEVLAILSACDSVGQSAYERLRAYAAVLLARRYGLRLSDISCLRRDAVQGKQIRVRAMKNGQPVWLPLYPEVRQALDRLPLPEGTSEEGEYFFWTGRGTRRGHITTFCQTLKSVYDRSGVTDAHTHRFRHTIASEMLAAGATIEDVADLLGDDPNTVREHYKHMIPARQDRLAMLLDKVHGAKSVVQNWYADESDAAKINKMQGEVVVPEEGLERQPPLLKHSKH